MTLDQIFEGPSGDTGVAQLADGSETGPDELIRARAVGPGGAPPRQPLDLSLAGEDTVGDPASIAGPSDILEVLDRPAAEGGLAEPVLVGVLGQMGVESYV